MRILILNGPNLNLLGTREPSVYGTRSFDDCLRELRVKHPSASIDHFQSNLEGELIDRIQSAPGTFNGIILNAGGYTHTSVAIADAVAAIPVPVVEVHLSNLARREPFRHTSLLTPVCRGAILGFGLESYELALLHFLLQS